MAGPGLIASSLIASPLQVDTRRLLRAPLPRDDKSVTQNELGQDKPERPPLPQAAQYQQVVQTLETASQNATSLRPARSLPYANLRALKEYESTQQASKRDELSQLLGVDIYA